MTMNVFMKMKGVMWLEKDALDAAMQCIAETYQAGEEFVYTAEEYVEWFLPYLQVDNGLPPLQRRRNKGGRKKKK